ncbi:protein phosphatase 4, regulatory subunit 2 [Cladochytrium tenue]|nr:protein phosphatase 4, regulatory subunit 2 [Cladochytrium tenue]
MNDSAAADTPDAAIAAATTTTATAAQPPPAAAAASAAAVVDTDPNGPATSPPPGDLSSTAEVGRELEPTADSATAAAADAGWDGHSPRRRRGPAPGWLAEAAAAFASRPEATAWGPALDAELEAVARSGEPALPWPALAPLVRFRLAGLDLEPADRDRLLAAFDAFVSCVSTPSELLPHSLRTYSAVVENDSLSHRPPFTLQRLCELVLDPSRHYNRPSKVLVPANVVTYSLTLPTQLARAIEKNLLVTSAYYDRMEVD